MANARPGESDKKSRQPRRRRDRAPEPGQKGGVAVLADAYAAEHMAGGNVLARDKLVSGKGYQALLLVPGILFFVAAIMMLVASLVTGGNGAGGLAAGAGGSALMTAMFVMFWLTGSAIRTTVTTDEIHVQCGLLGPRIRLDRVKLCKVSEQRNRLRTGIRWEDGMWTSSYLIALGEYVELVYFDDKGRDRRVRFSAGDPAALVRAVNEGRARAPSREGQRSTKGLRVGEVPADAASTRDDASETEREVDDEALAERPRRRRAKRS